jgi:uncharacterized coiled-coil protein SlyX
MNPKVAEIDRRLARLAHQVAVNREKIERMQRQAAARLAERLASRLNRAASDRVR